MLAVGDLKVLRDTSPEPKIRSFLRRGEAETTTRVMPEPAPHGRADERNDIAWEARSVQP